MLVELYQSLGRGLRVKVTLEHYFAHGLALVKGRLLGAIHRCRIAILVELTEVRRLSELELEHGKLLGDDVVGLHHLVCVLFPPLELPRQLILYVFVHLNTFVEHRCLRLVPVVLLLTAL